MSAAYVEQDPPKKPRHRHSPHQLVALNEVYEHTEHPSLEVREELARKLGMKIKTVNSWYQNKVSFHFIHVLYSTYRPPPASIKQKKT